MFSHTGFKELIKDSGKELKYYISVMYVTLPSVHTYINVRSCKRNIHIYVYTHLFYEIILLISVVNNENKPS